MYRVLETEAFGELVRELDATGRRWVHRMQHQYQQSLMQGKHLRGGWLYEKKFGSMRLYVVIHQDTALFVGLSRKNDQEHIIREILFMKEELFRFIERV
jgi:hypothetical protein